MNQTQSTGFFGEQLAKDFLIGKGYEIRESNWRFKKLEVDLIAYHNQSLIFIEVKTRTNLGFGKPEEFVDKRKEVNMARAAREYIYRHKHKKQIRFDIISIELSKNNQATIFHIEDAFFPY